MDVEDLQIKALKYGQLVKMASNVGVALFRAQHAIIHGSLYSTMPHEMYKKLSEAQSLLQEVENWIDKKRKAYGEE